MCMLPARPPGYDLKGGVQLFSNQKLSLDEADCLLWPYNQSLIHKSAFPLFPLPQFSQLGFESVSRHQQAHFVF